MDTQNVFMSFFPVWALEAGMKTVSLFNYHTQADTRTLTLTHRGVKQCALIKHSHYTQEEIPAGAVYQSLVHFLLLLFFLLSHIFFSFLYLLLVLFTWKT